MDAKEIGRYKVGDDELVLRVPEPDDVVAVAKVNAIVEKMEATEDAAMNVKYFAVLLSVLSGWSTEEIATMVPLPTITQMVTDFREWTDCLRPMRPC
jgi:hypothetical protein